MKKNRILVAEDDKAIADGIALHLHYSDYEYKVFDDGSAAAEYLKHDHSFDIALLDIMLPGIDGFGLLEHMKAYNIPVIHITAKTDEESEIQGLRNGAEDYITKPFSMQALLVRIEKILKRTGKPGRMIHVRGVSIDTEKRKVIKDGAEVPLMPLEFDLLVMLAKYKNRCISRNNILNEIWGTDFFGGTRTVDVHISRLRKKLDFGQVIVTVPKSGYRLED